MMSDQQMGRRPGAKARDDDSGKTASAIASGGLDIAQDAAHKVSQAASRAATAATDDVKTVLNRQVGNSADVMGQLATSTKRTADELEQAAPFVAGMVRTLADKMDGYADSMRGQSVDQLLRGASDLTRRQPAVVFGLAAVAGFLTCRMFRNAASGGSYGATSSGRSYESTRRAMPRGANDPYGA
jgi:uncharacterized membrane protein YdfJ with MMPL/SSD domain